MQLKYTLERRRALLGRREPGDVGHASHTVTKQCVFSCIVYMPLNQSTTPPLVLPYTFLPGLLLAVWEAFLFPLPPPTLRKFIGANQQAFSIRPAVSSPCFPFCAYALGFLCVYVCCSNIRVFGTRTVEPARKARTSYRRQILFFSPTEAPLLSMTAPYSPLLSFWSHFPSSLMLIKRVRGDVCSVRSLSKWPGKLCKRVEPVSSNGKRGGVKSRDCVRLNSNLSMQHHALEAIVGVFPGPQRNTTWRFSHLHGGAARLPDHSTNESEEKSVRGQPPSLGGRGLGG